MSNSLPPHGPPCSSVHGIFQARVLEWVATAFSAGLPIHHQLLDLSKLVSIDLVMPSNHLILCHPLLLLPSIFPSSRVFLMSRFFASGVQSTESFSFNVSLSNEYSGLISFRMDWLDLLAVKELSRVFSNTTGQKHQFFGTLLSL